MPAATALRQPLPSWPKNGAAESGRTNGAPRSCPAGLVAEVGLTRLLEHEVDLGGREAGELDVEIDVDKALQLFQQITVRCDSTSA